MREQLIQYVNLLFAGSPDNDMKQEILQNTLDRYDDLLGQGKSPEAAYRLAISGIGDMSEVLNPAESSPAPAVSAAASAEGIKKAERKKRMQAVAIGMYICCVVPVIALGGIGDGTLGVCLMFLMIAAATVLLVMSSDQKEESRRKAEGTARNDLKKPIRDVLNTVSLVLFFILSFVTGAWYITWLIFPIMAAVKGIIRAALDLKEARKYEN